MISKILYISQGETPAEHLANLERTLDKGISWVQLRLKNLPFAIVQNTAQMAKTICDRYNAKLHINDYPKIAQDIGAFGVHLGKNDASILETKSKFPALHIGGTANTIEDCKQVASAGADYIGLGPYRFTTTKKNLSPVLGVEGYRAILTELRAEGVDIPVIAIGGILPADIPKLMDVGVDCIAMSGWLTTFEGNWPAQIQALIGHA